MAAAGAPAAGAAAVAAAAAAAATVGGGDGSMPRPPFPAAAAAGPLPWGRHVAAAAPPPPPSAAAADKPTIIRLKRRRGEMAADTVVVALEAPSEAPAAKRAAGAAYEVMAAMAALSTESVPYSAAPVPAPPPPPPPPPAARVLTFTRVAVTPAGSKYGGAGGGLAASRALVAHVKAVAYDKFGRRPAGSSSSGGGGGGEGGEGGGEGGGGAVASWARTMKVLTAKREVRSHAARAATAEARRRAVAATAGGDGSEGEDEDEVAVATATDPAAAAAAAAAAEEEYLRSLLRVYDVALVPGSDGRQAYRRAGAAAGDSSGSGDGGDGAVTRAAGVRVVRRRAGVRDLAARDYRATFVPLAVVTPGRVFTPMERMMDEAVWMAFTHGNFGPLFQGLAMGGGVNFQRARSALHTPLMAAAHHGRLKEALHLLRHNALVRLADSRGWTAVRYAAEAGHGALATLLADLATEEEEEVAAWHAEVDSYRAGADAAGPTAATEGAGGSGGGGGKGEDEYEYDVYVLADGAPSAATEAPEAGVLHLAADGRMAADLAAAQARAAGSGGGGDGDDDGYASESDWIEPRAGRSGDDDDADSHDSEDSNAEDAPGCEYPDEERGDGGGDGGDDDDDGDDRRDGDDSDEDGDGYGDNDGGRRGARRPPAALDSTLFREERSWEAELAASRRKAAAASAAEFAGQLPTVSREPPAAAAPPGGTGAGRSGGLYTTLQRTRLHPPRSRGADAVFGAGWREGDDSGGGGDDGDGDGDGGAGWGSSGDESDDGWDRYGSGLGHAVRHRAGGSGRHEDAADAEERAAADAIRREWQAARRAFGSGARAQAPAVAAGSAAPRAGAPRAAPAAGSKGVTFAPPSWSVPPSAAAPVPAGPPPPPSSDQDMTALD